MIGAAPSRVGPAVLATLLLAAAACGKDGPVTPRTFVNPAAVVRLVDGGDQITLVGGHLAIAPTLSVRDANDRPVSRRRLTARVTQGGGLLAGPVITDADGMASLAGWTMGPAEGLNAIDVEVDGLAPLTVYAKAVPASSFNIEFRYLTPVSERQRAAFDRAAARWRQVIVGELSNITASRDSFCGLENSALNEVVDDLLIFVMIDSIDGPGDILGSAGPCTIRSSNGIPVLGAMRFDRDDVAGLENSNRFGDVVLHEIGHILGLGTLWTNRSLIAGPGGDDPYYLGESARAGFITAGGSLYTGLHIPLENTGERGTRDSHWRETVLNAEVMTGFVEAAGIRMPLSLTTIGALEDLGYRVSIWGDDAYTYAGMPSLSGALPRRSSGPDRELIELPFPEPDVITESGRTSPISARVVRTPAADRSLLRALPRPVQQLEVRRPN